MDGLAKGRADTMPSINRKLPATENQFYVYAIYVDGIVRYIGKGSNGRVHFHVIEAERINRRRALGAIPIAHRRISTGGWPKPCARVARSPRRSHTVTSATPKPIGSPAAADRSAAVAGRARRPSASHASKIHSCGSPSRTRRSSTFQRWRGRPSNPVCGDGWGAMRQRVEPGPASVRRHCASGG
jgi:hypothetical protein